MIALNVALKHESSCEKLRILRFHCSQSASTKTFFYVFAAHVRKS